MIDSRAGSSNSLLVLLSTSRAGSAWPACPRRTGCPPARHPGLLQHRRVARLGLVDRRHRIVHLGLEERLPGDRPGPAHRAGRDAPLDALAAEVGGVEPLVQIDRGISLGISVGGMTVWNPRGGGLAVTIASGGGVSGGGGGGGGWSG